MCKANIKLIYGAGSHMKFHQGIFDNPKCIQCLCLVHLQKGLLLPCLLSDCGSSVVSLLCTSVTSRDCELVSGLEGTPDEEMNKHPQQLNAQIFWEKMGKENIKPETRSSNEKQQFA